MSDSPRALVVGYGSIGRRHTENLQALGVSVAVSDPDADAREQAREDGGVGTYASVTKALDDGDPEFVVVATPNRYHVDVATEAARAGCHFFVEKPLSHELAGVDELQRFIERNALVSLVGCNLRFHPAIRKIHELIDDERIGPVVAARIEGGSYLPDWFPESDYSESYSAREDLGGGVILDYIHEINYARWFFGNFRSISAMARQRSKLDVETNDVAGILGETHGGVLCEFHLDYVQREYSRSCHVVGEDGTIRWSWEDGCVRWYTADDETWHTFQQPDNWETNDMYLHEIAHFLSRVESGEETICPVDCGRRDLEVALAARESAKSKNHISIPYRE